MDKISQQGVESLLFIPSSLIYAINTHFFSEDTLAHMKTMRAEDARIQQSKDDFFACCVGQDVRLL
jgi:hypothetical protein